MHPIKKSFSSIDTGNVSELMGSAPSHATSEKINFVGCEWDAGLHPAPAPYEPLNQEEKQQPCLFLKGVVDDCYQSRLLARLLEYYFVDNDPSSFGKCRCPMENCWKRTGEFDNPKDMIKHLKRCDFFKQGFVRCPQCDEVEGFRTNSKKSCSWNRLSFKHRAQKKLKAAFDTIKKFASSQSDSTVVLGRCGNCGHTVTPDGLFENPEVFDNRCSTSALYDADEVRDCGPDGVSYGAELFGSPLAELHGSRVSKSLTYSHAQARGRASDKLLLYSPSFELQGSYPPSYELQGSPSPTQPVVGSHNSSNHSSYTVSDQSPLSSSPMSRGAISSSNVSPTFTESVMNVFTNNSQGQSLSTNQYQSFRSATQNEVILNNGHDMEQAQTIWKPQETQQQLTLSIQTNSNEPSINELEWGDRTFYTSQSLDAIGTVEELGIAGMPSTPMMPRTPPTLPDIGNFLVPSFPDIGGSFTPEMVTPTTPSSSKLTTSSPTSDRPLGSGLSDDELSCHCGFRPTGKEGNHKAYLRKHLSTHENPTFKCEICDKPYTRRDNMVVHLRNKHHRDPSSSNSESPRKKRASMSAL
ncbi:hypothetical protein F4806DRAFT_494985 [Annulohypoxylon nitens]|nr:hypothetical protein F4806DRAFT_494985 [Annulohypoxylon nitens]